MTNNMCGIDKIYIWDYNADDSDNNKPLLIVYNACVPVIGDRVSIWVNDKACFKYYKVVDRVFGTNDGNNSGVWNVYVEIIHKLYN